MLTENLKDHVYQSIKSQRVLLIVSLDVDALCASQILKVLLQHDNTQYTIVPVTGKEELKTIYNEHKEQIKHFFLINCGGNIDLLSMCEADDDSNFYIVDSHRPLDLNNVYRDQVKVLVKDGDTTLDDIPEADKVIEYEDEEDEESEDEGSENEGDEQPSAKRQRTGDITYLEKKVKKKKWVNERDRLLDEYYECSYYGPSVATILFELAWKLTKDNNTLLWLAIVGLTEQYLFSKIDREKYFDDYNSLRDHVLRHNITDDENAHSIDCVKISFENELRLDLYRHWSIFESFFNSQYACCCLRLFTMKGKKRLLEMFADIGVPIVQCQQKFGAMDVEFRGHVKDWIENQAEKYSLEDLSYGSFVAQHGYKNKYSASDYVYTIASLLENSKDGLTYSDNFLNGLDSIASSNVELQSGIKSAKTQIETLVKQVRSFIDSHQVVCAGPFLYAHVLEGSATAHVFARPSIIGRLARFTLHAYSVMTKNKKAKNLPFIMAVPYNSEEGTSILVGVPPVNDTSFKSFFGAAFKQAGEKTKSRVSYDFFDPTIIEIKTEDRSKFFDNLAAIMA